MACEARKNSTFFYADFEGSIDQSLYMGNLENINFDEPIIIIAELDKENISLDPENNRYESNLSDIEERIQNNIIDQLPLQHKGNVPKENLRYYCELDRGVKSIMTLSVESMLSNLSKLTNFCLIPLE